MQWRLTLVLAALVLAVTAVTGSRIVPQTRASRSAEFEQALLRDARTAAAWVAAESPASDLDAWGWVTRASRAFEARVALLDDSRRSIADSALTPAELAALAPTGATPEVEAALAGDVGLAYRRHPSTRSEQVHAAAPVPVSKPATASSEEAKRAAAQASPRDRARLVRITRGTESIDRAIAEQRWLLFQSAALGLLAAIAFGWAARRIALYPIDELRSVVAAIARGDLDRRARRGKDPVGEIAGSINAMAEQLRLRLDEATAEKDQLGAVLASMVEGVLVLDEENRVLLINPRARELLSVWDDIRGQRPLSVARNAALADALEQASKSRDVVVTELKRFGPDSRSILVHAIGFPPKGTRAGTVAVFHDVSEIRKLEQVRRDFIANASHELRTPLTSIQGFAETLGATEDLTDEQRVKYTEAILRNSHRLGALINDLLSLSRIESRRAPMSFGEIELARVSEILVGDLQPRIREAQIECTTQIEADVRAWGDTQAVEQVITNLLDNAIKYTEPGGSIEVSARIDGEYARVSVRDTGIGIPEADRARVFERFYRVDKARSRALGGTGLGLAIVKHLVRAMDGEITVRSEPGQGSVFSFTLPRKPPPKTE